MLKELENYYKQNGILATSFTCKYKQDCSSGCDKDKFTGPKSAFVSSGYEKNTLPRLLFLSLDSGSGDKNNENRLAQAVRQQEEIDRDVQSLHKGRHWYLTHELAEDVFRRFDENIEIEQVKKYFAHANSAKCCMNNNQNRKASTKLFINCRNYLAGEIEILSPEIIISQGDEAKQAVHSLQGKIIKDIDKYASIIELNNQRVFWLHTYHPRAFRYFYKQRDKRNGWRKYSDMIYDFIQNKC